jgi:LmbE family N-acetylglucosaminyl deacetylase
MSAFPTPARALAIGAHCDDVEFGAGGTLARWADDGCVVHLCVCTDGSKGSWDPAQDVAELVATRQREQRAAAALLGAQDVTFLGAVDGELEPTATLRRAVAEVVRLTRPDIVLGHDPWQRYRLHPDHRAAGFLTTDGVVAARDWHFFPDAGPPHRPQELWLFEADEPDHVEGIDATLDRKVAALLAHRSQWRSTMGIADDVDAATAAAQTAAFADRVAGEAAEAAAGQGPRYGEAFRRIREV